MTKKMAFVSLLTCLSILSIDLIAMADSGLSHTILMLPDVAASSGLYYGNSFFRENQMSANDSYFYFLNLTEDQLSEDKLIFHGRASYHVPIDASKLDESFFKNETEIQKLVGSSAKINLHTQDPFVFANTASSFCGFIQISSVDTVEVYEWQDVQKNINLATAVNGLSRRAKPPVRVVIQDASHFSKFIDRSFMLSFIYEVGPGQTDIEVVSAILLNELPHFGEMFLRSTTKSDLEAYVSRLSKEKL